MKPHCILNHFNNHTYTMLQDFVRHFHVLLPRGTSPTKSGIREFFRRIHLPPAGYQVGNTMVRILETSSFVFLSVGLQHCAYLNVPAWRRCSCGRRSVSVFRPSSTRKSCGESSRCSAASGPSWRGSTLLAWGGPLVSSRWDHVVWRRSGHEQFYILAPVFSFMQLNQYFIFWLAIKLLL